MNEKKELLYYLLILLGGAVLFLLFPLFFSSTVLTMGLVLIINPIYCIVTCLLFTVKFGIRLYLPLSLAVLFVPSVFLYYGLPYFYYCGLYGAAAFVGSCAGYPIYKRYQQ